MIRYSLLKQDVDTSKAMYTEFLQKTNQAYLEVAQQNSNIRVIAPAGIPKIPVGPNRQRTILLGFFLSLVSGFGLAWVLERMDDSIRSLEDVQRFTPWPALAVIPAIGAGGSRLTGRRKGRNRSSDVLALSEKSAQAQPERLMEFDGRSPAAEAYRALRTGLLLSAAGNPPKTILVTSVRTEEGKTTTATNVAISLAQLGASVLLMDCDLRKPSSHKVFGVPNKVGMSTVPHRKRAIDQVTQKMTAENFSLIPAGPTPPNPAELLSSDKMKELLKELGERYDHIVIDTPPLGSVTDPVVLSTMVDGVILVVHGGKNSRPAVQRACHELSVVGARIFGIVLNNVNLRKEGYDQYYYSSYYTYGTHGAHTKS